MKKPEKGAVSLKMEHGCHSAKSWKPAAGNLPLETFPQCFSQRKKENGKLSKVPGNGAGTKLRKNFSKNTNSRPEQFSAIMPPLEKILQKKEIHTKKAADGPILPQRKHE